jgi:ankyrin repeat protein
MIIDWPNLRANLICLFEKGANLHTTDSENKDVLMHAILQNDEKVLTLFIQNAKDSKDFLKNNQDENGRNVIHYVVQPMEAGSFENSKILAELVNSKFGFDLQHRDKMGQTPMELARQQKSGVMVAALTQHLSGGRSPSKAKPSNDVRTYTPASEWPAQKFNATEDSQALLDEAEKRKQKELIEDKKDSYVPLDKEFAG